MDKFSCLDDYDPQSLSPDEALANILEHITAISQTEKLPIKESLGRILAEDITAKIDVPPSANAAMDGYAIFSMESLDAHQLQKLKIVGSSFAGKPFDGVLKLGECIRIMTGAVIPEGADAVVAQEEVNVAGQNISISKPVKHHANIRSRGEDIQRGDIVLMAGTMLSPADLGLLASLGHGEVRVYRRLKIGFFSTGDELRQIGEALEDGMIYDSNRYTISAMIERLNIESVDLGVVKDDPKLLEQAFLQATSHNVDAIITSGGVSVGDADYVRNAINKKGKLYFWKVAMKPGRPLSFGQFAKTLFFGLPGNPVSVMVTFYQFVQPALKKLMGATTHLPLSIDVICGSNLHKRPGRVEYQRGILQTDADGNYCVYKTGQQGSGILTSMSVANCFIVLPLESEGITKGDRVKVQPFYGLI